MDKPIEYIAPRSFVATDWIWTAGHLIAVTTLDRDREHPGAELIGTYVAIGRADEHPELYKVVAVELFMHSGPWHAGEKIGLHVAPR